MIRTKFHSVLLPNASQGGCGASPSSSSGSRHGPFLSLPSPSRCWKVVSCGTMTLPLILAELASSWSRCFSVKLLTSPQPSFWGMGKPESTRRKQKTGTIFDTIGQILTTECNAIKFLVEGQSVRNPNTCVLELRIPIHNPPPTRGETREIRF